MNAALRLLAPLSALALVACRQAAESPEAHVAGAPAAARGGARPPAAQVAPRPSEVVVVRADRAASRGQAAPRTLRRLLAERRGRLQLAHGYATVSLVIGEVLEGALDDPGYARRPVGVNALEVVLTGEAAHAAPDGLEGFAGTWRLTRDEGGALLASGIEDTPFPRAAGAARKTELEAIRSRLRATAPAERIAGLDALERHPMLELIPDVIALLDDTRDDGRAIAPPGHSVIGPRSVRAEAERRLHALVAPLADESSPPAGAREPWRRWWSEATTREPELRPALVSTDAFEILRPEANQTWPELAATVDGTLVLSVSRLLTPIDGHTSGVALVAPRPSPRRWAYGVAGGGDEPTGLDVAVGPAGVGVLFAAAGTWRVAVLPAGARTTPRAETVARRASHAAIAPSDTGFVILYGEEEAEDVFALTLDATGKPSGAPRAIRPLDRPATRYHHGIHPFALARTPRGWLAAVETESRVVSIALGEALDMKMQNVIAPVRGAAQPQIAIAGDRALIAWTADWKTPRLCTAPFDLDGNDVANETSFGDEVDRVARPVALDDGSFAVAWIESRSEVLIGRWDRDGMRHTVVTAHRGHVSPSALALVRDGDALVVAFHDTARWPYTLRGKRLDLTALR